MGGVVKKIVDTVIDPIGGIINDAVDFIGKTLEEIADFADNVVKGVANNIKGMFKGIVEGDWTNFRDSFVGVATTVVYVVAAIYGGPIGIAAAMVALDGRLTTYAVTILGKVERELFGSENILNHVDEISTAVIIAGSLYAAYVGMPILAKASGVAAFLNQAYVQVSLGIYSISDAYMQFQEAQSLYEDLMADYQKWLEAAMQKSKQFNEIWDAVYGDIDLLYEASAGGYLFNAGAGSNEYSVSAIHEQSTYLLGIDNQRDIDFDRYFNDPMDIDYPALNIEDTKPEIIRYQV
jgi:hypothetical protein